jgi:hypothetical protein
MAVAIAAAIAVAVLAVARLAAVLLGAVLLALALGYRRRLRAAVTARAAIFGPCFRASLISCLRCAFGRRRQMSHAPMAMAHGVGRSLRNRPAMV